MGEASTGVDIQDAERASIEVMITIVLIAVVIGATELIIELVDFQDRQQVGNRWSRHE